MKAYEEITLDVLNHIILNQELTLEHLELFDHMRERLSEEGPIKDILESNYQDLKAMKVSILTKAEEGGSYISDKEDSQINSIEVL